MEYLSISLNHFQFPSSRQHFSMSIFFALAILEGMKWYLIKVLIYNFLIACGIQYLFVVYWPFVYLLLRNVYSNPLFNICLIYLSFCCWVVRYIHTHTHIHIHIFSLPVPYHICDLQNFLSCCRLSFKFLGGIIFRIWSSLTYLFFFCHLHFRYWV